MPIQLIWGEDTAASERAIDSFTNEVIDPLWTSMNLSRFDGLDIAQTKQALEECCTPPFGDGCRVIVLRRSPICNNCPSEISQIFEEIIDLIPHKTFLILNNPNKPDKRLKSTKLLEKLIKSKQVIEKSFILPSVWDKSGQKAFINRTAEELQLNLTQDATLSLIEAIGNDSGRLTSELKKLALFVEARNEHKNINTSSQIITAKNVNELIQGKTTNSMEIGNNILNKEIGKAISLLDILLDTGEPPLRILATLTGQVRGWLWVSLLEKEGERDVNKISKAAGIANPKRIYIIRKQIQGKTLEHFLRLLNQLLEIEASLKRGTFAKHAFRDGLLIDSL